MLFRSEGSTMLNISGFYFQKNKAAKNNDNVIYWRCQLNRDKSVNCKSTCKTVDGLLVGKPSPHNHSSNSENTGRVLKFRDACKKRCKKENKLSMNKIYLQELGNAVR